MMTNQPLVYISGALTMPDAKKREKLMLMYELAGNLVKEMGYTPYLPHLISDPVFDTSLTPEAVDHIDRSAISLSRFMIAFGDVASFGVGKELEIAFHCYKPILLVFSRQLDQARLVSRIIKFNTILVPYDIFEVDGLLSLRKEIILLEEDDQQNLPQILWAKN